MSNASPTKVIQLKVNSKSGTRIIANVSARYPAPATTTSTPRNLGKSTDLKSR